MSQKVLRLYSFLVRCINKWNALSEEIVCSDTVLKFKTTRARQIQSGRDLLKRQLDLPEQESVK